MNLARSMAMENSDPVANGGTSRRRALALMLGAAGWLPAAPAAAESDAPIRLAISESIVADVNINDARAAMLIWVKKIAQELNVTLEFNPKVFDTTEEIVNRVRKGQLDAVVLNVTEFRQVGDGLDSSQLVAGAGSAGLEQYVILTKRDGPIKELGDLRGRRLNMLTVPKMCVAPAWLSTILDDGHHGSAEQFFGSVIADARVSRVVLPVFFGQAEACLTLKRGFDTMCELNPQVSRDLRVLAGSPSMMITFYIFCKNVARERRQRLIKALGNVRTGTSGKQLAMLFQFEELMVWDAGCLTSALSVLDRAERIRARRGPGGRTA